MRSTAKNYFEELFEENLLDQVIDNEDNDQLTAPFCIEDFKEAMFSMQPDKCPGPDGFNPGFNQHFWSVCRDDIYNECYQWLKEGKFPPSLNSTNVALIPKGTKQNTMKDWRPIALCNVLYKLPPKILANSLKKILHKCIVDSQLAFLPGRSILDNALVAIELVHYIKTKTKGNEKRVALKLDISKAYDTISWSYLKDVMYKMRLSEK